MCEKKILITVFPRIEARGFISFPVPKVQSLTCKVLNEVTCFCPKFHGIKFPRKPSKYVRFIRRFYEVHIVGTVFMIIFGNVLLM